MTALPPSPGILSAALANPAYWRSTIYQMGRVDGQCETVCVVELGDSLRAGKGGAIPMCADLDRLAGQLVDQTTAPRDGPMIPASGLPWGQTLSRPGGTTTTPAAETSTSTGHEPLTVVTLTPPPVEIPPIASVPLPAGGALLLAALGAVAMMRRKA